MQRLPLLSGSRVACVDVPDDGVVLRPPAPRVAIEDVGSAVRQALRFPLAGKPLSELVTRGGTATVVIEVPTLPIPSAAPEPRHEAIAVTVDELERLGVARLTILVASGLQRRPSAREIGYFVPPEFRRRFRGTVIVHDAEAENLIELGRAGSLPIRVSPALVETDLIVTVTAAETVLNGGPAALLKACGREMLRASGATSLLETGMSQGWELARALERLLAARAPVFGVSLVLNLPHVFGGYPYEEQILERLARSRLRRGFTLVPDGLRRRVIERVPRELTAAAVFGGTPSTAHTEALLRAIEFKGAALDEPLDAIVIGIPPTTLSYPRERPNPVIAAYLGLGLALRLWRNAFPRPQRWHGDPAARLPATLPRRRRRRPIARSSRIRERHAIEPRSGRPSAPRPPTRARSPTTAPAARCTRSSRSSPGAHATPSPTASAACSSPAAETRRRHGNSASCPYTASAPRSAWRAGAAPSGSASCSRRPTSRCSSDANRTGPARPASRHPRPGWGAVPPPSTRDDTHQRRTKA